MRQVIGGLVILILLIGLGFTISQCGKEAPQPQPPTAVEMARAKERQLEEQRQVRNILDAAAARPMNCYLAAKKAFGADDGQPQVWIFRHENGFYECFDTGGYYRLSGQALTPITKEQSREILGNPSLYPVPAPFPTPPALPSPPPVIVNPTPMTIILKSVPLNGSSPTSPPVLESEPCCDNR